MSNNNNNNKKPHIDIVCLDCPYTSEMGESVKRELWRLILQTVLPEDKIPVGKKSLQSIKLTSKYFKGLAEAFFPKEKFYENDTWINTIKDHNLQYARYLIEKNESFDKDAFEFALGTFLNTQADRVLAIIRHMLCVNNFPGEYYAQLATRYLDNRQLFPLLLSYSDIRYNEFELLQKAIHMFDTPLFYVILARGKDTNVKYSSATCSKLVNAAVRSHDESFAEQMKKSINPLCEFKARASKSRLEDCYVIFKLWVCHYAPKGHRYRLAAEFLEAVLEMNNFSLWEKMIKQRQVKIQVELIEKVFQSQKRKFIAHVLETRRFKLKQKFVNVVISLNDKRLTSLMIERANPSVEVLDKWMRIAKHEGSVITCEILASQIEQLNRRELEYSSDSEDESDEDQSDQEQQANDEENSSDTDDEENPFTTDDEENPSETNNNDEENPFKTNEENLPTVDDKETPEEEEDDDFFELFFGLPKQ